MRRMHVPFGKGIDSCTRFWSIAAYIRAHIRLLFHWVPASHRLISNQLPQTGNGHHLTNLAHILVHNFLFSFFGAIKAPENQMQTNDDIAE